MQYPNSMWSGANEDVNISRINLDPAGPPVGGKAMRYDFPDRTNDPNLCHDYTIGRNIKFPSQEQEVWVEIWAKFDGNFVTVAPTCSGTSSAGYKFVFLRVNTSERFNLIVGVYGNSNTWGYPDDLQAYHGNPNASQYFDGQWHRWRFHARVGQSGIAAAYLDNTKIADLRNIPINRQYIDGIALGRNMNQGPIHPQSLKLGSHQRLANRSGLGVVGGSTSVAVERRRKPIRRRSTFSAPIAGVTR